MNRRARLDRIVRGVRQVKPTSNAVRAAMQRFKQSGELPEDSKLARAVTQWCETGINAYQYDDDQDSQAALIRAYVNKDHEKSADAVMEGLYKDAVFGAEPARGLARDMLRMLAKAGRDPSTPLWKTLGWTVPTMTCTSMALSLARFPTSFVHRRHRPRAKVLARKLVAYGKQVGDDEIRVHEVMDAIDAFFEAGDLPEDQQLAEVVLWNAEMSAYLRLWRLGEDSTRLLSALHAYWSAPADKQQAALGELRAAIAAGPKAGNPAKSGGMKQLRKHLRHFYFSAAEAEALIPGDVETDMGRE